MEKKSKYAPQEKYQKEHYSKTTVKIPIVRRQELDALAVERGVSINYLIKYALLQTYNIDCFSQK